jgi:hypothetical protein
MIVQLTPKWKWICDRCGKEIYPNEDGWIEKQPFVAFHSDLRNNRTPNAIAGEICKRCYIEFITFAENFFDEVNKTESEGN